MPEIIVKVPVYKLEMWLDTCVDPPALHISLPWRDKAKNLWLLREAIRQIEGSADPNAKLVLPK